MYSREQCLGMEMGSQSSWIRQPGLSYTTSHCQRCRYPPTALLKAQTPVGILIPKAHPPRIYSEYLVAMQNPRTRISTLCESPSPPPSTSCISSLRRSSPGCPYSTTPRSSSTAAHDCP